MAASNDTEKTDKRMTKQEIMAQKQELATRPDTKVVFARIPETHMLLALLKQGDVGISTLKARAFRPGYEAEKVQPLITNYYDKCKELQNAIEDIYKAIGFDFKRVRDLD